MNEAEIRAEHIDPALKAAGWGIVEASRIRSEHPITFGALATHTPLLQRGCISPPTPVVGFDTLRERVKISSLF